MQVLILGCGDIGTRVGLSLLDRGWRVAAARRNPDRLPDFAKSDVELARHRLDHLVYGRLAPVLDACQPFPRRLERLKDHWPEVFLCRLLIDTVEIFVTIRRA